jgi:amino acid transporter
MQGLKKNAITLFGAVATTCAFMGPATSVYFNTGIGIQNSGNAFGFAFLLATLATLFVAYAIAQFARKVPTSGFAYTFATRGIGPKTGFVTGWLLIGGYAMVTPMLLAAIGYFLSEFFTTFLHVSISWGIFTLIIAGVILLLCSFGVAHSVRVALILLLIEVGVMVVFFAAILIHGGSEGINFATFNPANTLKPYDYNGIGVAVMWAIMMFVGFESAATLGEETQDAKKNIPKALLYAVIGIGAFYLISAFSAVIGYGPSHVGKVVDGISKGGNVWDTLFTSYWGKSGSIIVMLVILNSIFANLLSCFNSVVRIIYAMGREGAFPAFLGKVSDKSQVPMNAATLYMCASLLVTLVLGYLWDPMTVYGWAGTVVGITILLVYVIINISLFNYYKNQTTEFNAVKHLIVPIISTLLLLIPFKGVIMSTLPSGGGTAPMTYIPYVVVVWILLGIFYVYYLSTRKKEVLAEMGKVFES